jgi:tetratricopeptide (TPR) repeat protein
VPSAGNTRRMSPSSPGEPGKAKVALAPFALIVAAWLGGCAGHEARTLPVRSALDAGNLREAVNALDSELDVSKEKDVPKDLGGDNALLLLDRATVQQALAQFDLSARDFAAADKAIDMLDLAHNARDSIGEYVFSGSSGRYRAPPYEKLLVNTLNMINYLETADLSGALVEARRLSVMQRYIRDELQEKDNAILGIGGFLAGLAYEKHGDTDEALRYYDDALAVAGYRSLREPIRSLLARASYTSERLKATAAAAGSGRAQEKTSDAEIVCVIGYGRVPHKIPERVPIGLALTLVAGDIRPDDARAANRLAAEGLVTWVNYPALAPEQGSFTIPTCSIDGSYAPMEEAVNVTAEVRAEWKKIQGKIILSAITRMVSRLAVGQGITAVGGKDNPVSFLAALGAQAALTALDTPDTRSWETLPARIAVARLRVPAGQHVIRLEARGASRQVQAHLKAGDWVVASLQALR